MRRGGLGVGERGRPPLRTAVLAGLAVVAGGASAQAPQYRGVSLGEPLAPAQPHADPLRQSDALRPADDWIARDKALHAGGSFLLTLAGQYVLTDKTGWSNGDALPVAAGAALALGLAKEVADSRRERDPHFCWRDLAADAAGVALAAAVVAL